MSQSFHESLNQWMNSQRDKFLCEGDLYEDSTGEYRLTIQGEEKVLDLLIQQMDEPAIVLLLEQWYAERFEVPGPFVSDSRL